MPYFKTSDPNAVTAFCQWRDSILAHYTAVLALAAEVGADPKRCCRYRDGRFAAFLFEPDKDIPAHFRKFIHFPKAFVPRRTTTEGKQIQAKIRELPQVLQPGDYNRAIGFAPCLVPGMRICEFPASILYDAVIYFSLPDEATYTPPAHVTEILGSEYHIAQETINQKEEKLL